jgi:hypothetical protein
MACRDALGEMSHLERWWTVEIRNAKAKVFVNNCRSGEVGRLGNELTYFVTL